MHHSTILPLTIPFHSVDSRRWFDKSIRAYSAQLQFQCTPLRFDLQHALFTCCAVCGIMHSRAFGISVLSFVKMSCRSFHRGIFLPEIGSSLDWSCCCRGATRSPVLLLLAGFLSGGGGGGEHSPPLGSWLPHLERPTSHILILNYI